MSSELFTPVGRYRWHEHWITVPDRSMSKTARTHGVAVTRDGRVLIFHQGNPALLVYSPDGKLLSAWGDYPGAHGLTLVEENGEEFLWLVDDARGAVHKTTLKGRLVQSLASPPCAVYGTAKFAPTQLAVNARNGDLWLADGYGAFQVHRFNARGNYLQSLTGHESGRPFHVPHGVEFIETSTGRELWIADRRNKIIQVFDDHGNYRRTLGHDYLFSPNGFSIGPGWILVPELRRSLLAVDLAGNLLARIGENSASPDRDSGWPNHPARGIVAGKFNSPHYAAFDHAGNIYVTEWLIGGRVTKLERL